MEIQRGNSFQCFCDISPNLSTKKRKNFYLFHLKTISLKQNLNIFIKSPNRNRTIFPKIISPSISKSFLSYPLPSPFRISIKPTSKPSSKEQNLNTIHHPPASFLHRSSRKNIPSPFLFFLHPRFHCYCYCYSTLLIVRLIKIAEGNNIRYKGPFILQLHTSWKCHLQRTRVYYVIQWPCNRVTWVTAPRSTATMVSGQPGQTGRANYNANRRIIKQVHVHVVTRFPTRY